MLYFGLRWNPCTGAGNILTWIKKPTGAILPVPGDARLRYGRLMAVEDSSYDAVVVGAGAGGGFAAMALADAGLRVLLLERGERFVPQRDFPMRHRDWELHADVFPPKGADPSIELVPGTPLEPGSQELCSRGAGVLPDSQCARRGPFRYERVFGLGGTTLHYQGEAHRFADFAFKPARSYGFGVDWPIGYDELEPYYKRVEHVLGVAGSNDNPFKPPRGDFPTPAHPLSLASQHVRRGAAELGWSLLPNSLALPSKSIDGRPPCQHTGGCVQGCIFGAKSSVDLTALLRAQRTGRLSIRTGTRVLQLDHDGRRVRSLICASAKGATRVRARAVVLAAGAVETPRLLLSSQAPGFPRGLANNHDLVGRYFLDTLLAALTVRFEERLNPYKGPPIDSRIWNFSRPDASGPVRSGYVLGTSGTLGGFQGPLSYALAIPGIGLAHKRSMRERFATILTLFGIAEHEPRAENRLTLGDRVDEAGIPRVKVESGFSAADRAAFKSMIQRCGQWAQACRAAETVALASTYSDPAASHVGGGCRMGKDPEASVVDSHGRTHDVPNLFVADASVLVGQGAGDSPSLTIQALALRTAEHIAALMKRREL